MMPPYLIFFLDVSRVIMYFRLKWIREVGLMNLVERQWSLRKPPCIGNLGFNSIGITEVKPALMVLCFGFSLAFFMMIIELIHNAALKYKYRRSKVLFIKN